MRPQERRSRVLRTLSLLARNRLAQRLGSILRDLSEPSRTGVCCDEDSTTTLSTSVTDPQNSFIMVPMSLLLALGGYAVTRLPMRDARMAPWKKRSLERALDRKLPLPWTAYAPNAQLEIVATGQNDPQEARIPRAGATEVVIVLNLVSALVGRLGRTPYA